MITREKKIIRFTTLRIFHASGIKTEGGGSKKMLSNIFRQFFLHKKKCQQNRIKIMMKKKVTILFFEPLSS